MLATAVRSAGAGKPVDSMLVSGSSGVGKTPPVRHTLDRMEAKLRVPSTHTRALGATLGQVLRDSIGSHMQGERPTSNVPAGDLEGQLRDLVDEPCAVILDKADDLAGTDMQGTLVEL